MQKINPAETARSIRTIDNYIRYMCERIEFSMRSHSGRESGGEYTAESIYDLLQTTTETVANMQETLNDLRDALREVQDEIAEIHGT